MRLVYIIIFITLSSLISYSQNSFIVKLKNSERSSSLSKNLQNAIQSGKLKKIDLFPINSKIDKTQASNNGLNSYYLVSANYLENLDEELIENISPNYIYKVEKSHFNDVHFEKQWALSMLEVADAWNMATGEGVIVGVIDTGIDWNHPDLKKSLWINSKEDINGNGTFEPWSSETEINGISGDLNGIDEDGNGYPDDVIGFDHVDQELANYGDASNPDPIPEDESEHGTPVSGVISAQANNDIGIAGIAYNAKLLTSKAFDATGNAESDDIATAIIYAVLNGAKVLNFSFGEVFMSPIVHDAIKYAYANGVVMFSSSGNNNWTRPHYPSDHPEVISVGGVDPDGTKYGFGNYGSLIDFAAPATQVWSTDVNSGYDDFNGTSLAAPHGAAVAALLLEKDLTLSPAEIRGILQETAIDAGKDGWDELFAAGIINARAALENIGNSIFEIHSPKLDTRINKNITPIIEVRATSITPLFDSVEVVMGYTNLPDSLNLHRTITDFQFLDSIIARIDISNLPDSIYTISMITYLKNTKTIEKRVVFEIFGDKELTFENVRIQKANYNGKRTLLAVAETNIRAKMEVDYEVVNSGAKSKKKEFQKNERFSYLVLDNLKANSEYDIEIRSFTESDTITYKERIKTEEISFPTTNYSVKPYTLPRSYIMNNVSDLYSNELATTAFSDLTSLVISNPVTYTFENNTFTAIDTMAQTNIPIGIGDSNGDGIPELLQSALFQTRLSQGNNLGNSPFENVLYESNPLHTVWSEHFIDLDNDGLEEIIARSDSGYMMIDYSDKYEVVAQAVLPESYQGFGLDGGSAIGNYTNTEDKYLAYANSRGNLFIYKYDNNNFKLKYIDSSIISNSNQFLVALDIDNDGIDEIAQLSAGRHKLFNSPDANDGIWYLRIISYQNEKYEIIHEEFFAGLRIGFIPRLGLSYRNGVSAGELNGRAGDELIISTFPNLYVFSYNEEVYLEPLWHFPSALSNSAIVYDFDGNGINEIGFGGFNNTLFYEYNMQENQLDAPLDIDAWAENIDMAYMEWTEVINADSYIVNIVVLAGEEFVAIPIDTLSDNSILINGFEPQTFNNFTVQAYNSETQNLSDFSEVVTVFMNYPLEVINDSSFNNQVILKYSGKLLPNNIEPSKFNLKNNEIEISANSAIVTKDSSVILYFDLQERTGSYSLIAKSFKDYYGNPTLNDTIEVEFNELIEQEEIFLTKLELLDFALIKLHFSQKVDSASSTNIDNYEINPYGAIINISYEALDSNAVLMNLNYNTARGGARGKDYTMTAKNIVSVDSSIALTKGAGNTLGFTVSAENVDDPYVYPNPVILSGEQETYFANLTPKATIKIYTLDGQELRTIEENDGNGGVEWDKRDANGRLLETGVYMYRVIGTNPETGLVQENWSKFMVRP